MDDASVQTALPGAEPGRRMKIGILSLDRTLYSTGRLVEALSVRDRSRAR